MRALKSVPMELTLKDSLLMPVPIGTDFKIQVLMSFFVMKLISFLLYDDGI